MDKKVLPLFRTPQQIAEELVSVQPMPDNIDWDKHRCIHDPLYKKPAQKKKNK